MELNERCHFEATLVFLTEALQAFALSESVMALYWTKFKDRCTLAEWKEVCNRIVETETSHKVPTIASITEHLNAIKQHHRERAQMDTSRQYHAARQLAAESELTHEEALTQLREIQALLGARLTERSMRLALPINADDDPLAYTPTVDAETVRATLRTQLRQLLDVPPTT